MLNVAGVLPPPPAAVQIRNPALLMFPGEFWLLYSSVSQSAGRVILET